MLNVSHSNKSSLCLRSPQDFPDVSNHYGQGIEFYHN